MQNFIYIYISAVLFFARIIYIHAAMSTRTQDNKNLISEKRRIFARNLKEARLRAGYTQEDVIKKTGLTQPFLSDVENAKTTLSLDNACLLAQAVDQPLCKLLSTEFK